MTNAQDKLRQRIDHVRQTTASPTQNLINGFQTNPEAPERPAQPVSPSSETLSASDLKARFEKPKVEETHTRKTFLVRNDLLDRLEAIATGKHGFKTEFVNWAFERALNEVENSEE